MKRGFLGVWMRERGCRKESRSWEFSVCLCMCGGEGYGEVWRGLDLVFY